MAHPPFTAETVRVGSRLSYTRTVTEQDLQDTIALAGDEGGYHVDEQFARAAGFRTLITPGIFQAALPTRLGGDMNFLAREISFQFLKPVYVGDFLEVSMEVVEYEPERRSIAFRGEIINQDGVMVLTCRTSGFLPKPQWGVPKKKAR